MDTILVQTAGSPAAEIVVPAVKNARVLKQNILNVKNGVNSQDGGSSDKPVAMVMSSSGTSNVELLQVMTDIRSLLTQQNEYLRRIADK